MWTVGGLVRCLSLCAVTELCLMRGATCVPIVAIIMAGCRCCLCLFLPLLTPSLLLWVATSDGTPSPLLGIASLLLWVGQWMNAS
jgi:hypothetical protein